MVDLNSKTPPFSTPSFDLTNISNDFALSLTPFKHLISPHSDDASNISYYKPDESDGIEKQIQASIQLARKKLDVRNTDELDAVKNKAEKAIISESTDIDDAESKARKTEASTP